MFRTTVIALALGFLAACGAQPTQTTQADAELLVRRLADCVQNASMTDQDNACRAFVHHEDGTTVRLGGFSHNGKPMATMNDRDWFVYDNWFHERFGDVEYLDEIEYIAMPGTILGRTGEPVSYRATELAYYQSFQGP